MSQLATIWQQLQRVQEAIRQGSPATQDTTIAALQDTLATCPLALSPSFVYPLLTDVLTFYCRNVLPELSLSSEDRRIIRKEFEDTITHLNTQESTAKQLEAQLKNFLFQVKSGTFDSVEEVVSGIAGILPASPPWLSEARRVCFSEGKTSGDCLPKATDPLPGGVGVGFPPFVKGGQGGFHPYKNPATPSKNPLLPPNTSSRFLMLCFTKPCQMTSGKRLP
jgi:hypothetical protein